MAFRDKVDYECVNRVSQWARSRWLLPQCEFDIDFMERIYREELLNSGFSHRRCLALEVTQYLERWLWPNFDSKTASRPHVLSICAMVNEKLHGRIPIWQIFVASPDKFAGLINQVVHLLITDAPQVSQIFPVANDDAVNSNRVRKSASQKGILEQIVLLIFLSHCFTNLSEVGVLRDALRDLCSLAIWSVNLTPSRLVRELDACPRYARAIKHLAKLTEQMNQEQRDQAAFAHAFIGRFLHNFFSLLETIPDDGNGFKQKIEPLIVYYLERCLLLLIDFESMFLTRRSLNAILDDQHVVIRCQSASLTRRPEGKLFSELADMLRFYAHFQIDDVTGKPLEETDMDERHCENLVQLQRQAFKLSRRQSADANAPDDQSASIDVRVSQSQSLYKLAVSHPAGVETVGALRNHLIDLSADQLFALAASFALVAPGNDEKEEEDDPGDKKRPKLEQDQVPSSCIRDKDMLIKILIHRFAKRQSFLEQINELPLFPTEELLWDENRVPSEYYAGESCLALPKLGLQFLTLQDYLLRNFTLFRLESTFEIRQDIEDSLIRLRPWRGEESQTVFDGWSRMALPIQAFNIIEVAKPQLGCKQPARVRADVRVALAGLRQDVKKEWLGLRRHDPVFLVTVRPVQGQGWIYDRKIQFLDQFGTVLVRGAEIEGQVDKEGKLVPDEERLGFLTSKGSTKPDLVDTLPTWRLRLDACQYQQDVDRLQAEQSRPALIRNQLARARREGRSPEELAQLEAKLGDAGGEIENVYDTFNVLIRRKPKENNFKSVLETIRDLMNTRSVVPDWLLNLLLGYSDPASAHYSHRQSELYEHRQAWFDTFLDPRHVVDSFPQYQVQMVASSSRPDAKVWTTDDVKNGIVDVPKPPYRLHFPPIQEDVTARAEAMLPLDMLTQRELEKQSKKTTSTLDESPLLIAEPYRPSQSPPWSRIGRPEMDHPPRSNQVRFTPVQIEAIRSGMQPGLTLVVGPPGTGKTDVAVQIIHNLYQNYPNQRILIVTHSNQALNQLFKKIVDVDIDERHLLRLGHGEEELETSQDFSRYGRVDYVLAKRLELLEEVMRLANSLNNLPSQAIHPHDDGHGNDLEKQQEESAVGDKSADNTTPNTTNKSADKATPGTKSSKGKQARDHVHVHTCETAQYFFVQEVLSRWEKFVDQMAKQFSDKDSYNPSLIRSKFPFTRFFIGPDAASDAVEKLFPGDSCESDMAIARSCFHHLHHNIFVQLDEFRAFELMRTATERVNFLLVQEAKIIAMTCTHAALRRRDLVSLGFTYDTIVMEEAAQILEIETFIPLLLQNPDIGGRNRLKRWIMIGDHNQLPPVVKNQAFNNYSNMGQSLFARLVKLGVPAVHLDAQGRARPELARLFSWRYRKLTDLQHLLTDKAFRLANPGFRFTAQLINVEDFLAKGESEPSPFFFQNLGEAEYMVATYMYMRLLGYPADRIVLLTTYNGQKHLLRDIVATRCRQNPLFGEPHKITTVDRFQGQQSDYVLVSLVRTRTVGHLRDIRRLVVALSRARLGLYIFARVAQFAETQELAPAFNRLLKSPSGQPLPVVPHLVPSENWQDPEDASCTFKRQSNEINLPPSQLVKIGGGVEQMSTLVTRMYESKAKAIDATVTKTDDHSNNSEAVAKSKPSIMH